MNQESIKMTAQELLDFWLQSGLVSEFESVKVERFILKQQGEKELPIYMQIILGFGSLITCLFFLSFLSSANLIHFNANFKAPLMFLGVSLMVSAILMIKASGNKNTTIPSTFFNQLSLCLAIMGGSLLSAAFFMLLEQMGYFCWFLIPLPILLIAIITYPFFPSQFFRFMSTLAVSMSILVSWFYPYGSVVTDFSVVLNLYFLIYIALTFVLLTQNVRKDYIPLAYSVIFSLFFGILVALILPKFNKPFDTNLLNGMLAILLIGFIIQAWGGLEKAKIEPLLVTLVAVILLGAWSSPGIIFSLCFMTVGYSQNKSPILIMGICLLPVFLFFHNYGHSSILLIKSGILLLLGYGYMVARKLDREVICEK